MSIPYIENDIYYGDLPSNYLIHTGKAELSQEGTDDFKERDYGDLPSNYLINRGKEIYRQQASCIDILEEEGNILEDRNIIQDQNILSDENILY